jgi:hypothetical protein
MRCGDGTYSRSTSRQGVCSRHGGVNEGLSPSVPAASSAVVPVAQGSSTLTAAQAKSLNKPMTQYESLSLVAAFGTMFAALVGLLAVWYQVRLSRLDRAADNDTERNRLVAEYDRRRKQATIEYLNQAGSTWRVDRGAIEGATGKGALTQGGMDELKKKKDVEARVHDFLTSLELFAVGVNAEVLDADLTNKTCGSWLIEIYDHLALLIEDCQKERESRYIQFSRLVSKLRQDPRSLDPPLKVAPPK